MKSLSFSFYLDPSRNFKYGTWIHELKERENTVLKIDENILAYSIDFMRDKDSILGPEYKNEPTTILSENIEIKIISKKNILKYVNNSFVSDRMYCAIDYNGEHFLISKYELSKCRIVSYEPILKWCLKEKNDLGKIKEDDLYKSFHDLVDIAICNNLYFVRNYNPETINNRYVIRRFDIDNNQFTNDYIQIKDVVDTIKKRIWVFDLQNYICYKMGLDQVFLSKSKIYQYLDEIAFSWKKYPKSVIIINGVNEKDFKDMSKSVKKIKYKNRKTRKVSESVQLVCIDPDHEDEEFMKLKLHCEGNGNIILAENVENIMQNINLKFECISDT